MQHNSITTAHSVQQSDRHRRSQGLEGLLIPTTLSISQPKASALRLHWPLKLGPPSSVREGIYLSSLRRSPCTPATPAIGVWKSQRIRHHFCVATRFIHWQRPSTMQADISATEDGPRSNQVTAGDATPEATAAVKEKSTRRRDKQREHRQLVRARKRQAKLEAGTSPQGPQLDERRDDQSMGTEGEERSRDAAAVRRATETALLNPVSIQQTRNYFSRLFETDSREADWCFLEGDDEASGTSPKPRPVNLSQVSARVWEAEFAANGAESMSFGSLEEMEGFLCNQSSRLRHYGYHLDNLVVIAKMWMANQHLEQNKSLLRQRCLGHRRYSLREARLQHLDELAYGRDTLPAVVQALQRLQRVLSRRLAEAGAMHARYLRGCARFDAAVEAMRVAEAGKLPRRPSESALAWGWPSKVLEFVQNKLGGNKRFVYRMTLAWMRVDLEALISDADGIRQIIKGQ